MSTKSHKEADKKLKALEKLLSKFYSKVDNSTQKILLTHLKKFEKSDKKLKSLFDKGKITKSEYETQRWQLFCGNSKWSKVKETIAKKFTSAKQKAVDLIHSVLPSIFSTSKNRTAYEVEKKTKVDTKAILETEKTAKKKLREPLEAAKKATEQKVLKAKKEAEKALEKESKEVEKETKKEVKKEAEKIAEKADKPIIPKESPVNVKKEIKWNKQQIDSVVMQGIKNGDDIPTMAKNLSKVTEMNYKTAVRYARTKTTEVENAGVLESLKNAADMGIDVKKQWMATIDGRTRHTHAVIDKEVKQLDEPFSNGCRYPGDMSAPPKEVWNCRCTMVGQIAGIDTSGAERFERIGNMSYEEWIESHREALRKQEERREKNNE